MTETYDGILVMIMELLKARQVYLYGRIQQQGYSKCIHTFWDTCWGVGYWMFFVTINNSAQSTCKTCFHIFLISRWICLSVCVSKSFTVLPFEPCCCIMGSQICSHLHPPYSLMWQNVLVGDIQSKINFYSYKILILIEISLSFFFFKFPLIVSK